MLDQTLFTRVTADVWADKMSDFRTYQTEAPDGDGGSYMFSKQAHGQNVGEIIGQVHYSHEGVKAYSVLSTLLEDSPTEGFFNLGART